MDKYSVSQNDELIKEATIKFKPDTYFCAPEKVSVILCKCGGQLSQTSNIIMCSKNGSKCFER